MLSFLPGAQWFAIAGAVAAAGPIVIHLLNRRRFRVVPWAAMDFLREAVRRSRKILELRDLILLMVRTLAVWLFGLALARPLVPSDAVVSWRYLLPLLLGTFVTSLAAVALWSRPSARKLLVGAAVVLGALALFVGGRSYLERLHGSEAALTADPSQPLHAVLIVDNSLSMGYREERTLLDEAKSRAERFIERLPEGSRIAVIPLCGSASGFSLDPHPDKQDARTALERIELVDRRGSAASAIELAHEACTKAPELPPEAKRVVFFSDQQQINWPTESLAERLAELPEFQIVDVSSGRTSNTWVSSLSVQDGVADVQTPATIVVRVRHEGADARSNVQVMLSVDGADVAAKTIGRIEPGPGGETEIVFSHQFRPTLEPGQVRLVPVSASLPADQLRMDDSRHVAVPVIAAAPVVFVDEYGHDGEDPKKGRLGETRELRELLAPTLLGDDRPRELIAVRHKTIGQLDRKVLADARMVIVAGVADPGPAVPLLRQYVEQGGRLMIAAGGAFDAADWNRAAWLDGEGILPAPLTDTVGRSLEERTGTLEPFFITYPTTGATDGDLYIAGETAESLADLYREPRFFKAVQCDVRPETVTQIVAAEKQRLAAQEARFKESDARLAEWEAREVAGTITAQERQAREAEIARRDEWRPNWLLWKAEQSPQLSAVSPEVAAQWAVPRVIASFNNGLPFLVERKIGRGEVLLMTSSITSGWNTLRGSHAIVLADRLVRRRIERSLPMANVSTERPVAIPVDPRDARARFTLSRPGGATEPLQYEALESDVYGVTIRDVGQRGLYQVMATNEGADGKPGAARWPAPRVLAVNGPAEESQLARVAEAELRDRLGAESNVRWIGPGEEISLEGAQVEAQDLWWWLTLVVVGCLALEMTTLAWPAFSTTIAPTLSPTFSAKFSPEGGEAR